MKYVNITYQCDICQEAMDGANLSITDILLQGERGFHENNIVMCNIRQRMDGGDEFSLKNICEDCHAALKKYISILAIKE